MASNRKFNVPVNLVNLSSDPVSADEGDIYYNTTSDVIRVYANGAWTDVSGGTGGGLNNVVEDTTPQLGGDLDAQGNNITDVEYIGLDTTPATEPSAAGSIWWNADLETANLQLDSSVTLQIGQEHLVRVKNASGSVAIPNMTVVMFAGSTGDTVIATPAISTSAYEPELIIGITTEEIPVDGFGFVTQFGFVNNIDTTGGDSYGAAETWTLGDLLYSDPDHAGYLTNIQPDAPNWKFPIAAITRAHASSGRILVRAIPVGHLHDLTDVEVSSPTDNEILAYDNSSGTWINQTYDEAGLNKVYYQTSAPSSPAVGDIWVDSDETVAGYTGLPQVSTSTGLSLSSDHNGKHIYTTVTGQTHTIPANSSVALDIGTTFVFINPGSVTTTIAITSDTIYLSPDGATGSRTLAPYGMATAVKVTSTSWIISGNGLS